MIFFLRSWLPHKKLETRLFAKLVQASVDYYINNQKPFDFNKTRYTNYIPEWRPITRGTEVL